MTLSWSLVLAIAVGLLGISIMVIVHELGHLVAAKLCKISVQTLSFGFGPAIYKWGKKETVYQISAIPFGGYCRMKGQDDINKALEEKRKNLDRSSPGSIFSVSPLKRVITYLSGPVANILFAVLCYTILLMMNTIVPYSPAKIIVSSDYPSIFSTPCPVSEAGIKTGDVILSVQGVPVSSFSALQEELVKNSSNKTVTIETEKRIFEVSPQNGTFGFLPFTGTKVGSVENGSLEKKAGLKRGDVILKVNGKSVNNLLDILSETKGKTELSLEIKRNNTEQTIKFASDGSVLHFSLASETTKDKGIPLFKALSLSFCQCFSNFLSSVQSLIDVIAGRAQLKDTLSGTFAASQSIGIMTTGGFASGFNSGIRVVLYLLGSISISLFVANMLPIPALDGGQILLSLAELITRRTFPPRVYLIMQISGLVIIGIAIAFLQIGQL